MTTTVTASPKLFFAVLARFALAILVLMLMFFLPAGTWDYWEAWVYLAVLFVPMLFTLVYLLRRSPDLLERRMHAREKEPAQQRIIALSLIPFVVAFLLPGFDHRFGWSNVPPAVVLAADAAVLVGYFLVILVFRENRYASRVVEVEADQETITTGPYAVVRHPMYVGVLLMYLLSPLALGSYWAVLFALPLVWVVVARIGNEEAVLLRDLGGYEAYTRQVRYRLIPGVW